ncbi:reverse transcriptase domain-containing protein, partial [Tanacetum coccineum]
MARTPLNEHCSAVILNKLPKKIGDPNKFLIPCDFPGMDECLALPDLGASINLMPLSVWKKLSLPELTPTCMTLELAILVDFDADPQVPLILRRSFLNTGRALIDVYEGKLTLRVGKEAVTFNLDQTSRYSSNYDDIMANRITVIEMACEEYWKRIFKKRTKRKPKTTKPSTKWKRQSQIEAKVKKSIGKSTPTKSKVNQVKKIQLEGLKLPNLKLYYKNKKTRAEIGNW